jgi:hypothetical protein
VRLLLPVGAIMTIAIMHVGGYVVAARIPFSVGSFVEGYGGLLNLLLGLPDTVPIWTGPCIAAIAMAMMASLARGDRDHRLSLYVFHIVGLPLAMFVAELPNALYPRYYLASGIVFLLLLADLFGRIWRQGGAARIVATLLAAAFVFGNAVHVTRLAENGRDQTAAMMHLIGDAGPALVTSDQDTRNRPVIDYAARRLHLPVTYVPADRICAQKPTWMVSSWPEQQIPERLDTAGRTACSIVFKKVATFPQWGLSGLPWTVYRAE